MGSHSWQGSVFGSTRMEVMLNFQEARGWPPSLPWTFLYSCCWSRSSLAEWTTSPRLGTLRWCSDWSFIEFYCNPEKWATNFTWENPEKIYFGSSRKGQMSSWSREVWIKAFLEKEKNRDIGTKLLRNLMWPGRMPAGGCSLKRRQEVAAGKEEGKPGARGRQEALELLQPSW